MRIAIMGSGGVGAYVGAWLQESGQDVAFIARGSHLTALRRDGLRIEHPHPAGPEVRPAADGRRTCGLVRPCAASMSPKLGMTLFVQPLRFK